MASNLPWRVLTRFAVPIAIIVLPLLGFLAERGFDERITGPVGPALYAIYVLGLIAYATILTERVPPAMSSAAAGVLGTGAAISAIIGVLGAVGQRCSFLCSRSRGWDRGLDISAARTLRSSLAREGKAITTVWNVVGIGLAVATMISAQKADAVWLAARPAGL